MTDIMDSSNSDDRGRIPDLMKIGSIPTDLQMSFDTDILDPVVISENFCRFVLPNKGFLHSFSKITLGVEALAGKESANFPLNVGIHSLIERCALKIGTTTIAEVVDFGHYMAYKSLFIDNQINYDREMYLTNRGMAHSWIYNNKALNGNSVGSSDVNASFYTVKSKYNLEISTGNTGASGDSVSDPVLSNENAPVFSVSVADLFEFLKFNQLPLYMIDQQISIELHFKPIASLGRCVPDKTEGSGGLFKIDQTRVKFVSDHIFYDGDIMENYRAQNNVLNWTYVDYQLNKRSFTNTTLASKQVFNVGGAGRLVNKVFTSLAQVFATPDLRMTNEYSSACVGLTGENHGVLTTNLRYNDNYLFPIDPTNIAVHFHHLLDAEQNVPHISREEYSFESGEGGISALFKYQGYNPSDGEEGLAGKFTWLGYRLNRNERVSSRGIEVEISYSTMNTGTYIHRAYLEVVKQAELRNGIFSTDFA
tara:strand:+ start:3657 stop:5093 length:1437 start_codon:yes stop_codon:yes gene_type:complete